MTFWGRFSTIIEQTRHKHTWFQSAFVLCRFLGSFTTERWQWHRAAGGEGGQVSCLRQSPALQRVGVPEGSFTPHSRIPHQVRGSHRPQISLLQHTLDSYAYFFFLPLADYDRNVLYSFEVENISEIMGNVTFLCVPLCFCFLFSHPIGGFHCFWFVHWLNTSYLAKQSAISRILIRCHRKCLGGMSVMVLDLCVQVVRYLRLPESGQRRGHFILPWQRSVNIARERIT